MCNRFTFKSNLRLIVGLFGRQLPAWSPRYNILPSEQVLVLKPDRGTLMTWGYLSAGRTVFNIRSETAATKSMFRDSFQARRCVILADGFFEPHPDKSSKQLSYFHFRDDRPFGFAALWQRFGDTETCALLTTEPNRVVAPIHDRMPVILSPEDCERWLADASPEELQSLLHPHPPDEMRTHAVSPKIRKLKINGEKNDGPWCIEPVSEERTLF